MRATLIASLTLLGCTATIPEGRLACTSDSDCPPDWRCSAGRCFESGRDAGAGTTDAGPGGTDAGPGSDDAGPGGMDAGPGGSDAGPGGTDAGPGSDDAGPGGSDAGVDGGPGPALVSTIAAGGFHACAVASGQLYCWGSNLTGSVGDGSGTTQLSPVPVDAGGSVEQLSAGQNGTMVLLSDGRVRCWGDNQNGGCGDGTPVNPRPTPVDVLSPWSGSVVQIARGWSHSCVITSGRELWCWGTHMFGGLGDRTMPARTPIRLFETEISMPQQVAPYGATCAIDGSDQPRCWGSNGSGQLGDGTTMDRTSPVAVTGAVPATVEEVSFGAFHACLRGADGSVACMGNNPEGAIGDGTTSDDVTMATTAMVTDARQLSVGYQHTCVVRGTDDAVLCWGRNDHGEVGIGTTDIAVPVPTVVSLPRPAVQVSAGRYFTCAALDDGSLYCWGLNEEGQLGAGSTLSSSTPVRVPSFGP